MHWASCEHERSLNTSTTPYLSLRLMISIRVISVPAAWRQRQCWCEPSYWQHLLKLKLMPAGRMFAWRQNAVDSGELRNRMLQRTDPVSSSSTFRITCVIRSARVKHQAYGRTSSLHTNTTDGIFIPNNSTFGITANDQQRHFTETDQDTFGKRLTTQIDAIWSRTEHLWFRAISLLCVENYSRR